MCGYKWLQPKDAPRGDTEPGAGSLDLQEREPLGFPESITPAEAEKERYREMAQKGRRKKKRRKNPRPDTGDRREIEDRRETNKTDKTGETNMSDKKK